MLDGPFNAAQYNRVIVKLKSLFLCAVEMHQKLSPLSPPCLQRRNLFLLLQEQKSFETSKKRWVKKRDPKVAFFC
jgi:hypothetical protein